MRSETKTMGTLGNYTVTHGVSYQPLARNFWETVGYQQVQVQIQTTSTLTTNPEGVVDIDFSDGTITFKGENTSVFIQPGALSFGWENTLASSLPNTQAISRTVVDIDLFGRNWCSLKVSSGTGRVTFERFKVDGTEVNRSLGDELEVSTSVHRWPRIIVVAAAVYFVFEAGVAVVAPRVLPWAVENIPALMPLLGAP